MEAPEYLDLDEIDFTDDLAYSVTSLKSIPELCRRSDSQSEEKQVPAINWCRGPSSHGGNGIKPTGIADAHSKFRPVKRVSPLKHQPEISDSETDCKAPPPNADGSKEEASDKALQPHPSRGDGRGFKGKGAGGGNTLFGELEHYDLDMDEILDVPYIKSNQQVATLPRSAAEKRASSGGLGANASALPHPGETLGGVAQYCVLSPVKCSDARTARPVDADFLRQPGGVHGSHAHGPRGCSSAADATRAYPDSRAHKPGGGQPTVFPLQGCTAGQPDRGRAWGNHRGQGEFDEEAKKAQNIINIVREGQISLLPHLAADNLELVRDEDGNNLLHISASQGHAECLQHLTSLMGEDCLNERNNEQLTPAGLGIKNGHLECVRWMVSETEAIAELSCSRDHPSLIHYSARYGQEKILLWLLQFMQEQAISLDEVDRYGNSAVHVAAQHGHLGCIQTLVEYGSNVTVHNQQGERPSQSAERHGHVTCSRYLVVVETCMSLASQVVKLTKQLNEQTAEKMALQNQVQQLLESSHVEGSPSQSASSLVSSTVAWPEMTLTAEPGPGDGRWVLRQRDVDSDSDTVLRQLLGKEIAEKVCTQEKLSLEFREGGAGLLTGRRDPKLARMKQLMQRSLSESDSDAYPPEESRPERPRHLPIAEGRKHSLSAERKFSYAHSTSRSADGHEPSSDGGDHDHEPKPEMPGDASDGSSAQKAATSPKSALKSPSSRRKTSQSLKLRVTFDEPVVHKEAQQNDSKGAHGKESERGVARTPTATEPAESWRRPFGTFRSIMESFGGNQNSNSSHAQGSSVVKPPGSGLCSPGRKTTEAKASQGSSKSKGKTSAV